MKMVAQGDVREALPVGEYVARLITVKTMPASQLYPDSGPSYAWEFQVLEGPKRGSTGTAFTKTQLSTANNLGKLLRTMLGRVVVHGEEIDTDDFIGKVYRIAVDFNQSGSSTRVMRASPVAGYDAGQPAAPAIPQALAMQAPPVRPAGPAPIAPAQPPVTKIPVLTQHDYKIQTRWAFVNIGESQETKEMQVSALRQLVINGTSAQDISCWIPETSSWMTLAAVDMPF